jgi:membrane protease YdiL (CAAX protease family)
VFASVHVQYWTEPALLIVIAGFGIGQCLLYERTGSLFAVIATHAAFNAFASLGIAPVPALAIGVLVLLGCLLVPRRVGPAPHPMPA